MKSARGLLGSVAFAIGVLVALERNRLGKSQEQIGREVGLSQLDISNIETGKRSSGPVSDELIRGLFTHLRLPDDLASFVIWWRDHGH